MTVKFLQQLWSTAGTINNNRDIFSVSGAENTALCVYNILTHITFPLVRRQKVKCFSRGSYNEVIVSISQITDLRCTVVHAATTTVPPSRL